MHMLQRAARHPATLTAIAAAIVLAAATVAAPYVAPRMQRQEDRVGSVSIAPRTEMATEKINVPKTFDRTGLASATQHARNANWQQASLAAPQIERVANLKLYVNNVNASVAKVKQIARREGGDVFSLDVSGSEGDVEVRVPEVNFEATTDALARVGAVRERSSSAEDVSGDLTDSAAKLRNLRRTEADMLRIMDRSGSVDEVLNVENRLSDVRGQIEQLEADLKSMRQRVAYSTITTELDAEPVAIPIEPSAAAQLANQWHDDVAHLGDFTLAIAARLLWLVVFAPYVVLPAMIVWLLARTLARRRKDVVRGQACS
jgi:hypothetical protein